MKIRIFVGSGGVGKTSVAAAAGLKAAMEGARCLVLTIDPAARLKTALSMGTAGEHRRVALEGVAAKGELWVAQLDTRVSLEQLARRFATPEQLEILLPHAIFHALGSMAGMQELMAIAVIGEAARQKYDTIVVDTAPSRHALEFLDKPEFFVRLVTTPLVKLVGRTYHWWEKSSVSRLGRVGLELYRQVEKLVGAQLTRDVLEFFSAFQGVAEGYARETGKTLEALRDPRTTAFTIVSSPFKARADAAWFWAELHKRKFAIERLVVNRVWPKLQLAGDARGLIEWYGDVSAAQEKSWDAVKREFGAKIPRLLALPELPTDVDGLPALQRIAGGLDG
ncbi:MAG TPA: ArsA-related P-loop ATPase [Candidatus Sulfopaludibacter sp.]|jgi:anion-transporting  ArsA/GET3 family ATPase|nr:ArsA-related P-loop ATPase [Candidatus Sulfopaludibacter sp.]